MSIIFRVFFKINKFANAFSHSVMSFRFGKQDRVRKYRLDIFLFKVELGIVEINVLQTRNPIPPVLNQYWSAKFFKTIVFSFISV